MSNLQIKNNKTVSPNSSVLYDAFNPNNMSFYFDLVHKKLYNLLQDNSTKGLNHVPPKNLLKAAQQLTDNTKGMSVLERLNRIIDLHIHTGVKVNSTGYMARQFSSVVPVAAIYDVVSAMCPQPASFYECGPLPNVADKLIAEKFSDFLGWKTGQFDMISTSGASLANLTAVIAARNSKYPEIWQKGNNLQKNKIPTLAIGADSHFSVSRIAGILGLGQENIIILPLNKKRQICIEQAKKRLQAAYENNRDIFCIIAAAGSTSVGAIDPLKDLSLLAHDYNAWFHVDAAHNGAFLVSDQLRDRVKDLKYADSFCLDAHKTLFVPAACTLLFYKDAANAKLSFPTHASYVMEEFENEISKFESGTKNFECTKRPSILNLWATWTLYGREFFETKLNQLVNITSQAYIYLKSLQDFKVLHEPEANILCFQYLPNKNLSQQKLNYLQIKIRDKILQEGRYFISKVDLDEITAIRLVFMNHTITLENVSDLVTNIRQVAQKILENH